MDREVWAEMLETLPWAFKNISHTLTYSNGVLANAEFRRLKNPKPCKVNDAVVDDSDYVSAKGNFNPGAMLRSDQEDAITAGMLVRKDGQQRLTVAFHCWDEEFNNVPDKLGHPVHFQVRQADSTAGYVAERIDSTDIVLAKLSDVAFDNKFLDIGIEAKVLGPSSRIHQHDQFYIDSYATGPKFLKCAGIRVMGKNLKGDVDCFQAREEDSPAGRNALLDQGIYATNEPDIFAHQNSMLGLADQSW